MKMLQHLSVSNVDEGMDNALEVVTNQALPTLRVLDLGVYGMHQVAWASLGVAVHLTALGLEHCGRYLDTAIPGERMSPLPKAFPALVCLNLQHSSVKDGGLRGLAVVLPNMRCGG